MNKTTLEQWRCLLALSETGTYAKAADALFRTPSSVHQALTQLSDRLGVELVTVSGKNSRLTAHGKALLRRAQHLIKGFSELETMAGDFSAGWEAEIGLAVECVFPLPWLSDILHDFEQNCHALRLQLYESVLSHIDDLLVRQDVDLAITPRVPAGFVAEPLKTVEMVAVAHRSHALHQLEGDITMQELASHRQFIIRDPGSKPTSAGWQETERRWTVNNFNRSLECVRRGMGFGRFPLPLIESDLANGQLKVIPLREAASVPVQVFLVFADRERAGPGTLTLANQIIEYCKKEI